MANKGTAIIDFGTFPGSNEATVVVTGESAILAGSLCDAWIRSAATADHSVNDHAWAAALIGLSTGIPTAASGFPIYARSQYKMIGTFNLDWAWA